MALFLTILFCIFLLFIYFVPSFIAIGRKHTYVLQITLLNALLGWSFFGWAAALIWATTNHLDENVSTKLSWIIVSVFAFAVLFPVLFFFSIFGLANSENIQIKMPNGIQKIQYKEVYYNINPEKSVDKDKKNNHSDDD